MIAYYDAHTHLNDESLFPQREALLQEFIEAGGRGLVNVGASPEFNDNGLKIAEKFAKQADKQGEFFLGTTIGLHPYEVVVDTITQENIQEEISKLEQQYLENKLNICAIGECGIDTHYDGDDKMQLQKELFKMQCDLARKYNLPVIIHSRDAFDETLDVIKNYSDLKIYFHCRGYDNTEIKQIQEIFPQLRVGFCGNVSYKKAEEIRRSLHALDFTHMLLETDPPYLSPQIVRGKQNKPSHITHIYDFVAEELHTEKEKLSAQLADNFKKLYARRIKRFYTPTL